MPMLCKANMLAQSMPNLGGSGGHAPILYYFIIWGHSPLLYKSGWAIAPPPFVLLRPCTHLDLLYHILDTQNSFRSQGTLNGRLCYTVTYSNS